MRGIKGEIGSLGGGTVSTVESVESAPDRDNEWTAVRCVLQLATVTAEVLKTGQHGMATIQNRKHTRRIHLSGRAHRMQTALVDIDPTCVRRRLSHGYRTVSRLHQGYE